MVKITLFISTNQTKEALVSSPLVITHQRQKRKISQDAPSSTHCHTSPCNNYYSIFPITRAPLPSLQERNVQPESR